MNTTLKRPLWTNANRQMKSWVRTDPGPRYVAVLFRNGKGVIKSCPHRHTAPHRAVQCAKDLLAHNTLLRVEEAWRT